MPPGATADSFVRQSWMSDDYGYSRYGGKDLLLRFELRGSAALASPPARITSWVPTHCSVRPDDSRLAPFERLRERMQQARHNLGGKRRICGWQRVENLNLKMHDPGLDSLARCRLRFTTLEKAQQACERHS